MISVSDITTTRDGIAFTLSFDAAPKAEQRVVFDLYPNDAPSHPERHYGYFEIPAEKVAPSAHVQLDINKYQCTVGGRKYSPAWKGTFRENCPYRLFINIFEKDKRIFYREIVFDHDSPSFTLEEVQAPGFRHRLGKLRSAVWFITWNCNFSCPYCWEVQRIRAKEFTPEPFLPTEKWVEAWNRLEPDILDISGGEPFMQPDFISLLQQLKPSIKIGLTSNISHDLSQFVQKIPPEKILSLTISLHPTQRMSFELLSGKIRLLQNRGFKALTVNYVGWPEQLWMIEDYKARIEALGVRFHVDPYAATPYVPFEFSEEEKTYLSRFVESDRAHWLSAASESGNVACSGGAEHINVNPAGDAYRCVLDAIDKRHPLGNIFDSSFALNTTWTPCAYRSKCPGCDKDKVRVLRLKDS